MCGYNSVLTFGSDKIYRLLNTYLRWQKIQAFRWAVINHRLYLIQWILQGKINLTSNKTHNQNRTRNISNKAKSWIFICIICLLQAVKFGISRSTCDRRFKANMQNDCSKLSFFKRQGCKVSATNSLWLRNGMLLWFS